MKELYYKIIKANTIDYNSISKRRINKDFSGIYLYCSKDDAIRYLENKANLSVVNKLSLVQFTLDNDYYLIDNEQIENPNIKSSVKAEIIKQKLLLKYGVKVENYLFDSLDKPLKITNKSIYESFYTNYLIIQSYKIQ